MIDTGRLLLRGWRDSDRAPFAALCADREVMTFLGPLQTRAESDAAVDRMLALEAERGFCFWALERKADGRFLGFCGLKTCPPGIPHLADDIEIGWRLARNAWGQGYAREAAEASLAWGFSVLNPPRIFAMTVTGNERSRGLMERLGMSRRPDLDFLHPAVPDDHPLKPHIVCVKDA